jgi:hypothetical protein
MELAAGATSALASARAHAVRTVPCIFTALRSIARGPRAMRTVRARAPRAAGGRAGGARYLYILQVV